VKFDRLNLCDMRRCPIVMRMKEIVFCGGSDDLVGISGAPGCDEIDPERLDGEWNVLSLQQNGSPWSGAWDVVSADGSMRVHALYDGTWAFSVGMVDEDQPFPAWNVTIRPADACAYSVELRISAPDDSRIRQAQ
jgi:hypothetical protein